MIEGKTFSPLAYSVSDTIPDMFSGGRAAWGLLLVVSVSACQAAKTPAEECRRQNVWRRVGRSSNPDPRLNLIEDMRCDEMEREERREAREDAREKSATEAKAAAESANASASVDARLAAIRAAPRVPELGSTVAEAKMLCERQRGVFSPPDGKGIYRCNVAGPRIFMCFADDAGAAIRCDGFYEGADVADSRRNFEAKFGPPVGESIADGFRVFVWRNGNVAIRVTSYDGGVRLTVARVFGDEQSQKSD